MAVACHVSQVLESVGAVHNLGANHRQIGYFVASCVVVVVCGALACFLCLRVHLGLPLAAPAAASIGSSVLHEAMIITVHVLLCSMCCTLTVILR